MDGGGSANLRHPGLFKLKVGAGVHGTRRVDEDATMASRFRHWRPISPLGELSPRTLCWTNLGHVNPTSYFVLNLLCYWVWARVLCVGWAMTSPFPVISRLLFFFKTKLCMWLFCYWNHLWTCRYHKLTLSSLYWSLSRTITMLGFLLCPRPIQAIKRKNILLILKVHLDAGCVSYAGAPPTTNKSTCLKCKGIAAVFGLLKAVFAISCDSLGCSHIAKRPLAFSSNVVS